MYTNVYSRLSGLHTSNDKYSGSLDVCSNTSNLIGLNIKIKARILLISSNNEGGATTQTNLKDTQKRTGSVIRLW